MKKNQMGLGQIRIPLNFKSDLDILLDLPPPPPPQKKKKNPDFLTYELLCFLVVVNSDIFIGYSCFKFNEFRSVQA